LTSEKEQFYKRRIAELEAQVAKLLKANEALVKKNAEQGDFQVFVSSAQTGAGLSIVDGIFFALPIKLTLVWTNLNLRFATEFATEAHVWRSVGARLRLGQLHKSLIDKHKPFIHNSLQTAYTDQISVAPCASNTGN